MSNLHKSPQHRCTQGILSSKIHRNNSTISSSILSSRISLSPAPGKHCKGEHTMAFTPKQMSLIVATFGVLSFIFGVIAENKKPPSGTPITGKGVIICKYASDPTVVLGYLSFAFLVVSSVTGFLSLFYPYKGKSIPQAALFQNTSFLVFFNIALFCLKMYRFFGVNCSLGEKGTAGLAAALLLWPTIVEQGHLSKNVHHNLETTCPTAKTGLLGGGAFVSLDSALFWLVALMLADNAREDYFEENGIDGKSSHDGVLAS